MKAKYQGELVRRLEELGYEVIGHDSKLENYKENLERLYSGLDYRVEFYKLYVRPITDKISPYNIIYSDSWKTAAMDSFVVVFPTWTNTLSTILRSINVENNTAGIEVYSEKINFSVKYNFKPI